MILSLLTSLIIGNAVGEECFAPRLMTPVICSSAIPINYGTGEEIPLIYNGKSNNPVYNAGVLRGGVSVDKDLPEEFYGKWVVKSTLIDTNNPELFGPYSRDIWVFDRNGDTITLSNPLSGASASITVNEVAGKTAKFSRQRSKEDALEYETAQMTIEGDYFSGEDQQIIKHLSHGKIYKTDVVKYKVEGKKISGPALKDIFAK